MTSTARNSIVSLNINPQILLQRKEKINRQSQYVATIIVNLATFSYGTCVGWSSPVIPALQSIDPPVGEGPITEDKVSWIGSILFVGFIVGTPFYRFISDRYGRKIAGLLIAVPGIINWLLIIFSQNVYYIFAARFFAGFSTAGVFLIIPIYVGEISEDKIRGTLGTYMSIAANSGTLFSYIVGAYTLYHDFAIILLALPVLFFFAFLWMPETPIYLVSKGELKKAKRSLEWLRGKNSKNLEEELTKMSLLIKEIEERQATGSVVKDLIFDKGSRSALIIGVVVSAVQMLSGIYVVLVYTETIFQKSGSDIPANISTIIVGSLLLVACILACPLMDRAGRKILLVSSTIVMGISLAAIGVYFFLQEQGYNLSSIGFIPVVSLGFYVFFLGMGIGPVNMILLSELFLPHVRSTSASISTFIFAVLAFLVTRFGMTIEIYVSFWIFSAFSFLGALFGIFFIPETKNRDVYSIYAELSGKATQTNIMSSKKSYDLRVTPEANKIQCRTITEE